VCCLYDHCTLVQLAKKTQTTWHQSSEVQWSGAVQPVQQEEERWNLHRTSLTHKHSNHMLMIQTDQTSAN